MFVLSSNNVKGALLVTKFLENFKNFFEKYMEKALKINSVI